MFNKLILFTLVSACAAGEPEPLVTPNAAEPTPAPAPQPSVAVPAHGCGSRTESEFAEARNALATGVEAAGIHTLTYVPVYSDLGSFEPSTRHVDLQGSASSGITSKAGNEPAFSLLPIASGDRLIGVSYWACGNGVADVAAAVWIAPTPPQLETQFSGSNVQYGLNVDFNRADKWSEVVLDITPRVVALGDFVGLVFEPYDGPGYVVGSVKVTFERL